MKLWKTVQKTGLPATQDMCVEEAAMAANLMLTHGGVSPSQALTGTMPRDFYDPDNKTLSAVTGILETVPDAIEVAIRLRMASKDSILQSVVEDRLARAENTRVQQYKPSDIDKLKDGTMVDIWREPENKNEA